jgi:hypothetical protein
MIASRPGRLLLRRSICTSLRRVGEAFDHAAIIRLFP